VTTIDRVSDIATAFGESAHWDDRTDRLYFVDCAPHVVHLLNPSDGSVRSMKVPSMPAGLVLTDEASVVLVLDDGLYLVEVDREGVTKLTPHPDGFSGRFNDAAADLEGNIIVGSLGFAADADGSLWRFSSASGWAHLDDGLANVNGPAHLDGSQLVVADSLAKTIYRYDYDAARGTVANRRVFATTESTVGPDGATVDADGGLWSAMWAGGRIVRFDTSGTETDRIELPATHPTSVAFGGPDLDVIYVTTVNETFGARGEMSGSLIRISGTVHRGRPEPRFRL
jgi:sugar lactone lactonase YvrE